MALMEMQSKTQTEEKSETVVIHVNPYIQSDDIFVMVPPKYWGDERLAQAIAKAVKRSFEKK